MPLLHLTGAARGIIMVGAGPSRRDDIVAECRKAIDTRRSRDKILFPLMERSGSYVRAASAGVGVEPARDLGSCRGPRRPGERAVGTSLGVSSVACRVSHGHGIDRGSGMHMRSQHHTLVSTSCSCSDAGVRINPCGSSFVPIGKRDRCQRSHQCNTQAVACYSPVLHIVRCSRQCTSVAALSLS